MMRKPKGEERALWHHATRDVKPIKGRHARQAAAETAPEPKAEIMTAPVHPVPRLRAKKSDVNVAVPSAGLDRRSAQRLKRGQMPIEARLDLHGMTQVEAHHALDRFIAQSHAAGRRAVLVITGKSGVLYGAVPRWLEDSENRARILAASRAQAQHGGAGALYLLLRRKR